MQYQNQRPAAVAGRINTPPSKIAESDMTRLRILVLEKDVKSRFLLSRLLQGQGFAAVGGAACRVEALQLVKELRPHLLLIGATVSGAQSLQMVQHAKQQFPDLGVTALTDMQDFGIIGKLLELGAGAVLAAPVDSAALCAELRRAGNRCVAKLATRCILNFKAPKSERHVRALPSQCDYPTGPQLVDIPLYA